MPLKEVFDYAQNDPNWIHMRPVTLQTSGEICEEEEFFLVSPKRFSAKQSRKKVSSLYILKKKKRKIFETEQGGKPKKN